MNLPSKLTPDLSTEENREYWAFVRWASKQVRSWPDWKRGYSEAKQVLTGERTLPSLPQTTDDHEEEMRREMDEAEFEARLYGNEWWEGGAL